jgi:HlyB family type I secretion system ABC transporter
MTTTTSDTLLDCLLKFLPRHAPFDQLPPESIQALANKCQPMRYRMGQTIFTRETLPTQIAILYHGRVRLLGFDAETSAPDTLQRLGPGAVLGATGLIRGLPCETVIASEEVFCLTLPSAEFFALLHREPQLEAAFQNHCSLIEAFELLGLEMKRQAKSGHNLKELALRTYEKATVLNLAPGKHSLERLESDLLWLVSGGLTNFAVGSRLNPGTPQTYIEVHGPSARLVGFRAPDFLETETTALISSPAIESWKTVPYAPERPAEPETPAAKPLTYPYIAGKGPVDGTVACFQMLSKHWGLPFRRDILRRSLDNQLNRTGHLSLQFCGAVAEMMGLNSQLVQASATTISQMQVPALVRWKDSCAVLYQVNSKELVIAVPETGIQRLRPAEFIESWGKEGEVLLLQATQYTPKQRFGLNWFLPSVIRYRKVLIEVLLASFFVQMFGLANPLITQVIIDKVLVQNSVDTLNILGILLIALAVFEAVLTGLRTTLFVDTTNRIDLALGAEVIDHLLRLPLRYFEKRPVGELATRVNELENIRQFLTGTALTVVLDAVFSVIYIVVMVFYSWLLTLVALATIPLFGLLTYLVAPIIRQQTRTRAERNAETQSYLVEVLSGIQTVKAQNIELSSRWQWQDYYTQYVSAGFKTVLTATSAGAISGFLDKLSGLLLLWVGAYLVLQQQLTLGQLIAFRIIAGYTTSPLLRLVQLWQNFQETALSLERLSDILDTPQEIEEGGRDNIPMPEIQGRVRYENVSFRFTQQGPLQLNSLTLNLPAGLFVGVVGQSGAGKSTLTKLLPRLYDLQEGRILIDDYDIAKVELYSLRRQIGMVLQDTLLFDGTVQENIALTNPDASQEEIVEAARVAFAHDFIMTLPNGYNTRVGERGSALSGGQRQRIAIARTVLQNPRLLVLDEATSALDYNAERQVCLNLAQAFQQKTVFFITHRLGTIRHADVILMMDQGSIVEQGNHDQLMALKGRYYCLYQQQETQQ